MVVYMRIFYAIALPKSIYSSKLASYHRMAARYSIKEVHAIQASRMGGAARSITHKERHKHIVCKA